MRRIFLHIALFGAVSCGLLFPAPAAAQSKLKRNVSDRNAISIYPLAFVGNTLLASYERALTDQFSLRMIGGIGSSESPVYYKEIANMNSSYLELQGRFFPPSVAKDQEFSGFFIGPTVLYKRMRFDRIAKAVNPVDGHEENVLIKGKMATAWGAGIIVGYTFDYKSFTADAYLGSTVLHAYKDYKMVNNDWGIDEYRNSTVAHLGLSVGYRF
jgi:hypothetical protein